MKKSLKNVLIIFLILIYASCRQQEKSAIEVIKFDYKELLLLKEKSDSVLRLPDSKEIEVYLDNYFLKDSSIFWVWTDKKTGIVRGTKRIKNGITYNWVEYYATTGQLFGHSETDYIDTSGERHSNGVVKHYYEDGRIKLLGKYKDNIQVGDWKRYDAQGNLESIETYNNEGKLIQFKKISR